MFFIQNILTLTICTSVTLCINGLNNIDLKTCKVTHLGLCFTGMVSETRQGLKCQRWDDVQQANRNINYIDFPDGSTTKAVNYCRNPTKDVNGPWCFTASPVVVKQHCRVPLCSSPCQVTGPGMEYAGTVSESKYKKCEMWNETWHNRKVKSQNRDIVETFGVKHPANRFPDKQAGKDSNFCRNPDGSQGGPWCYVRSDKDNIFKKSYCDVPVCDERANELIAKQKHFYSHFISYNKIQTASNLTFAVRLWNPDHEHRAVVKILLSTLNIPMSSENLRTWATAVELTISNQGTGITIGNKTQFTETTADILKATEYTNFVVSWKNNVLDLYSFRESIYVEILSYSPTLMRHENLSYYSVSGDVAVWAFSPHVDDSCQEHTTFLPSPRFSWKLHQENVKFYLEVFVRSFHSAIIFLTQDPYHEYPRLSIKLGFPESITEVVYEHTEIAQSRLAFTIFPIDYWSWTRLRIVLLGNEFRLMTYHERRALPLLGASHGIVSSLRWFSIGSNVSLSHWALFCEPAEVPPAYPPECVFTTTAVDYGGKQWVSQSGLPCLPWFAVEPKLYEDESIQFNYCRNYKALKSGPWCYVQSGTTIKPEICNVRKCNAVKCKKAGTANDYVGELSVTRSNFTCKKWPRNFRKRHKHEMYPSDFFEGNFCRNPTRNVGGAWCFTTDPFIKKDLCDVKDCDKSESRILIMNKKGNSSYTFITPKWRDSGDDGGLHFSLKRWDPSLPEGIVFNIFSLNKDKYFSLSIGAKYNEELILRYIDSTSNTNALLVRKIFPHIMPAGNWREFRLKMPAGKIKLDYESKYYTILDWEADTPEMVFNPSFLNYESIGQDAVGIFFPQLECHMKNTSAILHSKIYPISWQKEDEFSSNLTLYLRGNGAVIIPLIHFPSYTEDCLVITINDSKKRICLENKTGFSAVELCCGKLSYNLISDTEWSRYNIFSDNNSLYVLRNNIQLIKWVAPSVIVYYFFSVAVQRGWILWTANCQPPDIDSPLQDGGWSPWSDWYCSVNCGKGVGYRVRKCTSPRPTIFGKPCSGSKEETGFCNDFPCGNISPQTYDLIRKNLQTNYFNIIAQEGDNVTFDSSLPLITRIRTESPRSQINWMHKGTVLKSNKEKYCCNNYSVVVTVKNITSSDNGVYVCAVKRNTHVNTPIKIVVLAVEPKRSDVIVYNGSSFEMVCTSALESIYADLWIKWYLDDELFAATDIAAIYFKNTLRIPLALWNHSGIWKCVMEQTELNLRWVIQIHKVLVIQKPSLLTKSLQAYASIFVLNLISCEEFEDKRCYSFGYITTIGIIVLIVLSYFVCRSRLKKKDNIEYLNLNTISSTEAPNSVLKNESLSDERLKTEYLDTAPTLPLETAYDKEKTPSQITKKTKSVHVDTVRDKRPYANPSGNKAMGFKLEILKKGQKKMTNKNEPTVPRYKKDDENSREPSKYQVNEDEGHSELKPLLEPSPGVPRKYKVDKEKSQSELQPLLEPTPRAPSKYQPDENKDQREANPLLKPISTNRLTDKRTHSTMTIKEIETKAVNYDDIGCTDTTCPYREEYYVDDGEDYDFDNCGDDFCTDETCFHK